MHGQSPAVHIVRLIAQEVEKLGITHSNQEIEAVVRIAHNEEQRRLLVAQRIEFQFVIRRQLTQFGDIEHRQPRAAGNQNAFRCFSCRQFEFFILAHREAIRLFPLQILKHQVNGIPEILVILACLHTADHINQRREVAIFLQRFLPQIADQRRVEQYFRLLMIGKALK